jgi:molybdopterin synthase catalytic subunit
MQRLFAIRETPLSLDECFRAVQRPGAGGVVLFVGTVRDHNAGQPVTALEYQAYAPMAEKELRAIAEEIEAAADVLLACTHRVGALVVGDLAVVCAASSPHRAEAFSACQQLIDRLKARVPVWKREHGEAGPYWVGWQDVRMG